MKKSLVYVIVVMFFLLASACKNKSNSVENKQDSTSTSAKLDVNELIKFDVDFTSYTFERNLLLKNVDLQGFAANFF